MPNPTRKKKHNMPTKRSTGTDGGGEGGTSGNWGGGATEGTDEQGVRNANSDIIESGGPRILRTVKANKKA